MEDSANATRQILPAMEWVSIDLIAPHPRNPRHADRSERFNAIVGSMIEHGFWPDKPLVVRSLDDGYQAIGGNTRLKAAMAAGIDRVFCSIQDMTDDEAIIRMAEDNLADPFNWAEQCVYIAENAIKDSKVGLSRVRLVQACTGKVGDAAEKAATYQGRSGELIAQLMAEQSSHLGGLLNSKKDLTRHLYEICVLPDYADREYLVGRLLSETLTIEQIRSIVDSVRRSRIEPTPSPTVPSYAAPRPSPVFCSSVEQPTENALQLLSGAPMPALQVVADLRPRKNKPEYNPIDILGLELEAANDRVEKLERLIYGLFNIFGDKVPQPFVDEAMRMGVFAFRYRETQNAV